MKGAPKADSFVETPDGAGTINSVNTLREQVRVRLDSAPDSLKTYHNSEIRVIRSGKGKRPEGYVEPPKEELAKLRKVSESPRGPVPPGAGRPGRRLDEFMAEHQEAAAHPDHNAPSRRRRGPGQERRTGRARPGGRGWKRRRRSSSTAAPATTAAAAASPSRGRPTPQLGRPGRGGHGAGGEAPPPPAAAAAGAGAAASPAAPDRRNPTGRPLPPNPERAGRRRAAPAGTGGATAAAAARAAAAKPHPQN